MDGRIAKAFRGSGAALAGLAAVALSACGLRVPADTRVTQTTTPTPTESPTPSPSPTASSATPSPTASSATPSPTATPTPSPTGTPSPAPTGTTAPPPTPASPAPTTTPTGRVVPGRPLRQRHRLLTPAVARGAAPVHRDHARLAALPAPVRADLAALWLHSARMEHASVPAFADLALLLSAVGAPLELLAAAHRAALDEVGHTEVSYALANAYGDTAHVPGALPRLLGRRIGSRLRGPGATLRRLAVEALRDGCLNEGYNAALAAAGAASATDPAVREALDGIARDEHAHTELSWQVLGWSLAAGGPDVSRAVARALRSLPPSAPVPTPRADLEEHGWPSPATSAAAYAAVRAHVAERAAGLVSFGATPSAA